MNLTHVSHLLTWARVSLCIPDQKYWAARLAIILRLLTWPADGESWFSFSSVSRTVFGTLRHPRCTLYVVCFCIGCHPPSHSPSIFAAGSLSFHAFPESSCKLQKLVLPMSPGYLKASLVAAALTKPCHHVELTFPARYLGVVLLQLQGSSGDPSEGLSMLLSHFSAMGSVTTLKW